MTAKILPNTKCSPTDSLCLCLKQSDELKSLSIRKRTNVIIKVRGKHQIRSQLPEDPELFITCSVAGVEITQGMKTANQELGLVKVRPSYENILRFREVRYEYPQQLESLDEHLNEWEANFQALLAES